MPDVLSRTLGDQEEVSAQADQLVGQLLPRHPPFRAYLGLPELRSIVPRSCHSAGSSSAPVKHT